MPMKKNELARIFAKLGKEPVKLNANCQISASGDLLLYGDIGDWWEGLDAPTIVSQLESIDSDVIRVRILSDGGDVQQGLGMYNSLKNSSKKVITINDGMAASMAGAIFLAGDERHVPKNAACHMHRAKGGVCLYGTPDDILKAGQSSSEIVAEREQQYVQILADGTGHTTEEINEIISDGKEHYYRGQAAIDFGFATHLIDHELKVAASLSFTEEKDPKDLMHFFKAENTTSAIFANLNTGGEVVKALKDKTSISSTAAAAAKKPESKPMLFKVKAKAGGRTTAAMITAVVAVLSQQYETVEAAVSGLSIDGINAEEITGEVELSDVQIESVSAKLGLISSPSQSPKDLGITKAHAHKLGTIAKAGGASAETLSGWISGGVSAEDASLEMLNARAAEQDAGKPDGAHVRTIPAGMDLKESIALAINARLTPSEFKHNEHSHEFAGMSLVETAKAYLNYQGERMTGKSKSQVWAALSHTTSDFPAIFEVVSNKRLLASYEAAPRTFQQIASRSTFTDFRAQNVVRIGKGSELKPLNESGELEKGTFSEAKNGYVPATYGREFNFTREMFINDDLSALTRFMMQVGSKASTLESKIVWELLTTGTPQFDGGSIFTVGKNTQIAGTADLEDALILMLAAMRKQVDLDGEPLNLSPAYLVVSPEREVAARRILSAVTANEQGKVNVFSNAMDLIVESRLSAANNPFYAFASPMMAPVLEYAYLDGSEAPFIETEQTFGTRGLKLAVVHDFAAGFVGDRGAVKNPGA